MKTILFIFLFVSIATLFSNESLTKSRLFQLQLKRNWSENTSYLYKHKNMSLYFSEYEMMKYNFQKSPFLRDVDFLQELVEFLPWEFYENYIENRILLYSFHGYIDFSLNLKKFDNQLLQFSIPLDNINFLRLFQFK
jgi:hypothetical protein